jgi:hypothetical protein
MSDHDETGREERRSLPLDRQTIRESIIAQIEEQRLERIEQEKVARRRAREDHSRARRASDIKKARESKGRRLKALNEANDRVRGNVAAAARSLSAALRAATEVPVSRHTDEGRVQQRTVRKLQAALSSLRGVGAGDFDETNFEIDLDLDVG